MEGVTVGQYLVQEWLHIAGMVALSLILTFLVMIFLEALKEVI